MSNTLPGRQVSPEGSIPKNIPNLYRNTNGNDATPRASVRPSSTRMESNINVESSTSGAASRSSRSSTSDRNMATTAFAGLHASSASTPEGRTSRMLSRSRPGRMSASPSNSPKGIINARRRRASREAPSGTRNATRPRSTLQAVTMLRRSSYFIVRSATQ